MCVDDAALAARVAAGDTQALTALMRRHNQRLYRAARSILHNETEAEDAVQEAWWKAYQHLREFRGESTLATWLTRIAANEALMRRRRNIVRAKVIQSSYSEFPDQAIMSDNPLTAASSGQEGPDRQAWRSELRHIMEAHIDALPDKYRKIFVLRGVQEMSSAEVAEALGVSEATVRIRYMRARRMLQTALKGLLDEHARNAFSFAGERCDRMVDAVHARLQEQSTTD